MADIQSISPHPKPAIRPVVSAGSADSPPKGEKHLLDYAALIGGRAAAGVLRILGFAIVIQALGPTGYGRFSLVMMISAVVTSLIVNWPNPSIVRFGRKEYQRNGNASCTFASRMVLFAATITLAFVGLVACRPWIEDYIGLEGTFSVFCIALLVFSTSIYEIVIATLLAVKKIQLSAAVQFVSKLGFVVVIGILALAAELTLKAVVVVGAVCTLLTAVAYLYSIRDRIPTFSISRRRTLDMVIYSWPVILSALSAVVFRWADLVLIKQLMNIEDVGFFSAAYQLANFLGLASSAVTALVFPLMVSYRTEGQSGKISYFINGLVPQFLICWNLLLATCAFAAQLLIPIFVSQAFVNSILPFQILTLGLSFSAIGCTLNGVTNAHDLIKYDAAVNAAGGTIKVIVGLILIVHLGIVGAAIATVVAYALTHQTYIYLVNNKLGMKRRIRLYALNLATLIPLFTVILCQMKLHLSLLSLLFLVQIGGVVLIVRKLRLFDRTLIELVERAGLPSGLSCPLIRVLVWFSDSSLSGTQHEV